MLDIVKAWVNEWNLVVSDVSLNKKEGDPQIALNIKIEQRNVSYSEALLILTEKDSNYDQSYLSYIQDHYFPIKCFISKSNIKDSEELHVFRRSKIFLPLFNVPVYKEWEYDCPYG